MYILGIVSGIAFGALFAFLVIKLIRKATHQEGTWCRYDERQQAARGKGYKYAFYTVLILNALAMFWYSISETAGDPFTHAVFLVIMLIGILVYVSYAIWSNAYIGTNETFRSSLILVGAVSLLNLVIGILNLNKSGFSTAFTNFGIGAVGSVICLEMIAKNLSDKRLGNDDE